MIGLNPMHISVMLLLTEVLLTGIAGFQVYLFRQVSTARREKMELRIEMAKHSGKQEATDSALLKLEHRFEKRLEHCLDAYFANLNKRNAP